MSSKSKGPLRELQTESDALKRQVDEIEKHVIELITEEAKSPDFNDAYHKCVDLKIKSSSILLVAHQLQQDSTVTKIANFEARKKDEIQRLQQMQKRLNDLMDKIENSCENADHLRTFRNSQELKGMQLNKDSGQEPPNGPHDDKTMDDEDSEEEEEEEEEEEGEEEEDDEDSLYEVIHKFEAERDGDLAIEVGEVVSILNMQDDGWWEVRNEQGKVGMVPSTFLQEYEEEEDEEENTLKEDTGEMEKPPEETRSGKDLWKGIKDAVNEPVKTDVTDVLAALGAIPAGFRPSTLGRLLTSCDQYTLKNAVLPAFTESNIGLEDLKWDSSLNQIQALPTRVLRTCRLWSCRMIPLAGSGVEVLSRHVRLALFNGSDIVSNIHTVRANCSTSSPKLWTFSPRVSGILPSILDGACTVRSSQTHSNLGILFELGINYIRTKTGEHAELSCGWVFLKLFDEQGKPIPDKTYELPVNGGTPYEKGVDVDPSINRRASTNRFRNLLTANKQPKFIVKIGTPPNMKKKYMNLLPINIVIPTCYSELISYYRRILADAMIRDRLSTRDADPISCPVLSSFPKVVILSDVMDALRSAWADKIKTLKRGDKRDKENMKNNFRSVFLETGYMLLHSATLPAPQWANPQVEEERWQKIFQQLQINKNVSTPAPTAGAKPTLTSGVLKTLLAPNIDHVPFDMEELNFNLLEDHRKMMPGV